MTNDQPGSAAPFIVTGPYGDQHRTDCPCPCICGDKDHRCPDLGCHTLCATGRGDV